MIPLESFWFFWNLFDSFGIFFILLDYFGILLNLSESFRKFQNLLDSWGFWAHASSWGALASSWPARASSWRALGSSLCELLVQAHASSSMLWSLGYALKILKLELTRHSMPSGLWIKSKKLSTGHLQVERACIRGSEYVLFEIPDWRENRIHRLDSLADLAWVW